MAQENNTREFLITHTQWDQAQVRQNVNDSYIMTHQDVKVSHVPPPLVPGSVHADDGNGPRTGPDTVPL